MKNNQLSTRESTLEIFRRINNVQFGNGDLKIDVNVNWFFINTISL